MAFSEVSDEKFHWQEIFWPFLYGHKSEKITVLLVFFGRFAHTADPPFFPAVPQECSASPDAGLSRVNGGVGQAGPAEGATSPAGVPTGPPGAGPLWRPTSSPPGRGLRTATKCVAPHRFFPELFCPFGEIYYRCGLWCFIKGGGIKQATASPPPPASELETRPAGWPGGGLIGSLTAPAPSPAASRTAAPRRSYAPTPGQGELRGCPGTSRGRGRWEGGPTNRGARPQTNQAQTGPRVKPAYFFAARGSSPFYSEEGVQRTCGGG